MHVDLLVLSYCSISDSSVALPASSSDRTDVRADVRADGRADVRADVRG